MIVGLSMCIFCVYICKLDRVYVCSCVSLIVYLRACLYRSLCVYADFSVPVCLCALMLLAFKCVHAHKFMGENLWFWLFMFVCKCFVSGYKCKGGSEFQCACVYYDSLLELACFCVCIWIFVRRGLFCLRGW